jgi:uncharacterized protein
MTITTYQASVPVLTRYITHLGHMLDKAQAHADSHKMAPTSLLQARLAPDMLPLATQLEIAANFVFRLCAPLAGQAIPAYGAHGASFESLQARLREALEFMASIKPEQLEGLAQRNVSSQAGQAMVTLNESTFITQYALPNFFFHITMAYAILRHQGVALGKADFDGFHVY